ncbi:MAG: CPBP family intramembrane glutamic endopeptidase [Gammaproteobacteria bacterium]|nr:CPBP family intramembrane glutamic endopeptidase [Gammaproteobacteria bacterium]
MQTGTVTMPRSHTTQRWSAPLVDRYPLAVFYLLACAISWAWAAPAVFAAWSDSARRAATVAWWQQLGIATGPLCAALLCSSARGELASFAARCVTVRLNAAAWQLAVALPVVILLAAIAIVRLRSGAWPTWEPEVVAAPLAFIGALALAAASGPGEEPGWRGYALPRLLDRWRPAVATVALAAVWILWHVPSLWLRGELTLPLFAAFAFALLCGSVWLTALYRLTDGGVVACILWHTVWNLVATTGRALEPNVFPWMAGMVVLVALALLPKLRTVHSLAAYSTATVDQISGERDQSR